MIKYYNLDKLRKESKRLKDLSFDEECSFEKSIALRAESKRLEEKYKFILLLRKEVAKHNEK